MYPTRPTPRGLRIAAVILIGCWSLGRAGAQSSPPGPAGGGGDDVIKMDAFTVSTTIGSYHEETSSMATKIPTDLKELASSLQVINANAIADRNAVALPDIFAYVVGATQTQSSINGFSFRGFPNTGTFTQNIEFDGLMGATLKKGASSSANVESIEFLKGPNGVLYGQMHPGGLLNIVTKSPKEIRSSVVRLTFGTFAGEFSSFGDKLQQSVMVDLTGPVDANKHLLYRLVVDTGSNPASRPGDSDRYLSLYPSLTYLWSNRTYFTVKFESSQDKRRQDDGLVPIFTSPTAYGANARWYTAPFDTVYQDPTDTARDRGDAVSTLFHAEAGPWTLRFQTRSVWHTDYTRELTVNNAGVYTPKAPFATPTTTFSRQYNLQINGHRYNFFDANAYRTFGTERLQNTLLLGVGGGLEFSDNQRFAFGPNVTPAITIVHPILGQSPYPADGRAIQSQQNTLTSMGEYVNDQLVINSRLHLSAGVRHDQQISHGIDAFNPVKTPYAHQNVKSVTGQAGIVFDVTRDLSAYASWSQSVVPNVVTSVDANGQSGFAPEKGLQYEAGVKFETPARNFYASLAAYFINRSNVLVSTGQTLPVTKQGIFRLDGQQHSEGVELELQWQPAPYWQLQGGMALGKAFVAQSGKNPHSVGLDLTNAPRASGNLWTRYNVPRGALRGLGLGLGVIYTGKAWSGDPTTALYYVLPGWTRFDLAAYYKWRRFEFALNVQNLFDRRYIASAQSPITLNPGETRKLTLSMTTRF
ncbi:MAG TPA: TonB-dependent receptor [Opitutaceae bacterium]|nr:TonB-dependent receptor [Opitutaceae bacterium]